ncbi:MAG TPA: hypothetical protein VMS43_03175 [Allosphingosinicella sp.]|nr:hypothetical protein [Allosphingosinicella sp.]
MSIEVARSLYKSARAHALACNLLYNAALEKAVDDDHPDPEASVFNGTYSLSIHYLIGLSLELYLKSAFVLHGGQADEKSLRAIGHKLVEALNAVEGRGFHSAAPNLREIAEHLNEPYSQHYFRYARPEQMALPDVPDVFQAFQALDDELNPLLFPV